MAAIFANDMFLCIFLNENFWISSKISLKHVPYGPIDNKPSLVQIMGCHRTDDKPISEPMMVYSTDAYIASLGLNELWEMTSQYEYLCLWTRTYPPEEIQCGGS